MRADVVVVGARAAGAATALLLARLGHEVVLVDRAVFPADTLSTHQLARPGVVQLHRWGLLDKVLASGAPPIRKVSFTAEGETTSRTVKHKAGVDLLVAPRRYVLDTILADAAVDAGVDLRQGFVVTGVRRDHTGRVIGIRGGDGVDIDARYVVGADGLNSVVARSVGADVIENRGDLGAVQYAYYAGIPWDGIELFIAERALAGVFPTHDGEACIWIATPSSDAHRARRTAASRAEAFTAQLMGAAPELVARLRQGRRVSTVTGMLRQPNILRAVHGPGWALVGDAGYHRDAVTGHGLSDAYRDAELLAVALHRALAGADTALAGADTALAGADTALAGADTALAGYQRRRDQALREVFELTVALAAYPPVPEFVELQKQLARALDTEAADLAARSAPALACA